MKYLALWFFIGGVSLIVFIQFISGQNVKRQISGNEHLLREVAIQKDLYLLQSDILTVESDIRGIIITGEEQYLSEFNKKISNIQKQARDLAGTLSDGRTSDEIRELNRLVTGKVAFSFEILESYRRNGKEGAEAVINTDRGKRIRDSIILIVERLDSIRQNNLAGIMSDIENNGNRARLMGVVLAVIACLACILAFLYIVNKGRQQERMIVMLNESEKRIKDSAFVKEQFLANMSHEIRTPMNAILGFTNLLKRTGLSVQQVQYVDYIHSSCQNLLALINDILDLSKIEAGMMSIEEEPFSLNGLISSVEVMFREKARQKGLRFVSRVDPSIHDTLSGDPVRITQILINLISNAVKFTDKGWVQLSVSQVSAAADKLELAFVVEDSGVGIPEEKRATIFDRFHQGDTDTTRKFGGTGLGLSIVRQLVDLQSGSINVESEQGKGTRFEVVLPLKVVFDYREKHAVRQDDVQQSITDLRVLIAEDNLMNQQLMRHLMKQWNIFHTVVNNGKEAVDMLRNEPFDVVLMDIQMPVLDGYVASQAIRNELKLDIPIIAMTAHAMVGEKERCLSYGMNDYISKPIRETDLFSILEYYANHLKTGQNNEQVIDLNYLRQLSLGDMDFENAIIRQFIVQVPDELELLREAVQVKNRQQIKSIAHGMKSSISYLGLTGELGSTLNRMELEAVSQEKEDHFLEDFEHVKAVCEQAVQEARKLISQVS